jgi:hypothetical protein
MEWFKLATAALPPANVDILMQKPTDFLGPN